MGMGFSWKKGQRRLPPVLTESSPTQSPWPPHNSGMCQPGFQTTGNVVWTFRFTKNHPRLFGNLIYSSWWFQPNWKIFAKLDHFSRYLVITWNRNTKYFIRRFSARKKTYQYHLFARNYKTPPRLSEASETVSSHSAFTWPCLGWWVKTWSFRKGC